MMTVSPEESRLDLLNAESVMAQIDAAQIDLLFDRRATFQEPKSSLLLHVTPAFPLPWWLGLQVWS